MAGQVLNDFRRKQQAVDFRFLLQYRHPGFQIGRLNIGDQPAHESVDDMLHHIVNFIRRPIGSKNYLFMFKEYTVENPVEFLLRSGFST